MTVAKTRASESILDDLHNMQANALLAAVRKYKGREDEMPPALFAQVNKFLKDNGVDRAVTPGDPTSLLEEEAPVFDNVVEADFK